MTDCYYNVLSQRKYICNIYIYIYAYIRCFCSSNIHKLRTKSYLKISFGSKGKLFVYKYSDSVFVKGCQGLFSTSYLKLHNTLKRKSLMLRFRNGLICLSGTQIIDILSRVLR